MKIILISFLLLSQCSIAQYTNELWAGIGLEKKMNAKINLAIDLHTRAYRHNLQLMYSELTVKYKVSKWCKPSVEYRGLMRLNKYGNYHYSHRFNFNCSFEKQVHRLSLGCRIRYQYVFSKFYTTANYSPEFDQTFRFKPSFKYNIKKNKLSPTASMEWFYNPQNGSMGNRFTKIRSAIGFDVNLKGPKTMSIEYQFGITINSAKDKAQNILSVSYTYSLPHKKQRKKKDE
jgi:hypothetical protein